MQSSGDQSSSASPLIVPRHVAIIMDGNGRWAKKRLLVRIEGHRAGARSVRTAVQECRKLGIRYLTLFTFSTENWGRPADEVGGLMKLFSMYLESEIAQLCENGVRLRSIGDRERLPASVQKALAHAEERTAAGDMLDLILAVSYGGREEILHAARQIGRDVARGVIDPEQIDAEAFRGRLYAPDIPDPDLLIRTSDEFRISNFLLWQLAYSEIVVTPVLWPEFSAEEFRRCIAEFSGRSRRFGLTEEQRSAEGNK